MGYLRFLLDSLIAFFSYYVGAVDQTPLEQRMSNFLLPGLLVCVVGFGLYAWRRYMSREGQGVGPLLVPLMIAVGAFLIYELIVYLIAF